MALVGRRLLCLRASLSSCIGPRSTSWSDSATGSVALLTRKYSSEPGKLVTPQLVQEMQVLQ